MNQKIIVLNTDYSFLNYTSWQRAVSLIYQGKAEPIRITSLKERVIRNFERTIQYILPVAIRLLKYVRSIFGKKVPYSKRNVISRDGKCMYCGKTSKYLTVDHIIPKSRGGKLTWENSVAACKKCNNIKGDRTPREAHMVLLGKPYMPTIHEFINIRLKTLGLNKTIDFVLKNLSGSS